MVPFFINLSISKLLPQAQIYGTVLFIAFLEFCVMQDHMGRAEFPGDYRNGGLDFGWDKFDDATKKRKRAIELNNGRAVSVLLVCIDGRKIA